MKTLLVQQYLMEKVGEMSASSATPALRALDSIKEDYGIGYKLHPIYPNLVQLTYSQIDSFEHRYDPIVCECRGLILDVIDNWKVVAYPFDRFFNHSELEPMGASTVFTVDWANCKVQEKLDGSLIILYNYNDIWYAATKGSPMAMGELADGEYNFGTLFWRIFCEQYSVADLQPEKTYMFEMTSKHNRIVCDRTGNDGEICLIGVRHNRAEDNFKEHHVEDFSDKFKVVTHYSMDNIDELISATEDLDPIQQEGFVVVGKNHYRMKVKSPKYVKLHHLVSELNPVTIIELIQTGETSEVFAYFPDMKEVYKTLVARYEALLEIIEERYTRLSSGYEDRKEFALQVQEIREVGIRGAMFSLLDGKNGNARDWASKQNPKKIYELLS